MKDALIVFVVSIVVGAGINSLLGSYPNYKTKTGVLTVQQTDQPAGMNRGDSIIPEMTVTDGFRRVNFMHKVASRENDQQADFPLNAGVQE
jgi:hypothetical protein